MSDGLREIIKNARDRKVETVNVPEWGVDVCFKGMTFAEAIAYEADHGKYPNGLSCALYLTYTLCDEAGNRLYLGTPEDVAELAERSPEVVSRLFHRALEFNSDDEKSQVAIEGECEPSPS